MLSNTVLCRHLLFTNDMVQRSISRFPRNSNKYYFPIAGKNQQQLVLYLSVGYISHKTFRKHDQWQLECSSKVERQVEQLVEDQSKMALEMLVSMAENGRPDALQFQS